MVFRRLFMSFQVNHAAIYIYFYINFPGAFRNPRQPPDTRKHKILTAYHENKDKLYTNDIK